MDRKVKCQLNLKEHFAKPSNIFMGRS